MKFYTLKETNWVTVLLCEPEKNIVDYNNRNFIITNEDFKILLFINWYSNFSSIHIKEK